MSIPKITSAKRLTALYSKEDQQQTTRRKDTESDVSSPNPIQRERERELDIYNTIFHQL
jgi:hypothetical protein